MSESVTISTADPLRLLRFVPEAARRVLDFGCGGGERLRALEVRGAVCSGVDTVDVIDAAAPGAVACDGLDTAELPEDGGPYDCILSEGALARLRDPARVIARFREVLAPGGLLVLSAPNMQYHGMLKMLAEGRWDYGPEGQIPYGQIRYFTGYELHKLLTARGFKSVKLMGLEVDPPEAFPLGADGYVRAGRLSVGPLTQSEHVSYLVRDYLLIGQSPQVGKS